jgi:hypothetical protein
LVSAYRKRLVYPFYGMNNKKLAGGNETVNGSGMFLSG